MSKFAAVTDDGKIMVDAEKHRKLQARVQELEDMAKDYREKVRSWASKALHENAEKCRLEAENVKLRIRAEKVRIALKERTVAREDSSLRRELEAKEFDKRCPSFLVGQQADDEGEA